MSYHTPEGFDEKCALRDDTAEHQIRIRSISGTGELFVSCNCIQRQGPIATITTADEAWEHWYAHHDAKGVAV